MRLVVSARSPDALYYAHELAGPDTTIVHTREIPTGFARAAGRLTAADLAPVAGPDRTVYVCGAPAFCDAVTGLLLGLDVPAARIRVERFGPSG